MNALKIKKLTDSTQIPWDLLLLADPSKEQVKQYIKQAETFLALLGNEIVGEYVLVKNSEDVMELKNIAVDKKYQGQGIGKKLVLDAIGQARSLGAKKLHVGTGNSSLLQLALYQKCGFKVIGTDQGFFLRNYKEPIIENGIQCVDMIRLSIDL